jgi:hypothetical protein
MLNILVRRWLILAGLALAASLAQAQDAPKKLSVQQIEEFLKGAKIVDIKQLGTGVTNSQRASLTDGILAHSAHVQSIDEAKAIFQGDRGAELNFRDTWKFNVAGYKLACLLGLDDMVPPSVERSVAGKTSSLTWWIDNSMMEVDRQKKRIPIPDKDKWNREMHVVRVFDQLIYNTDRNLQNLMVDQEFRLWMIDHSRAFRMYSTLKEKKDLQMCDRALLARLRDLKAEEMQTLKPYLSDPEIKGLLSRRDKIVQLFDQLIKTKGEAAVLYDRPPR